MSRSLNRMTLIGNLGIEPDVRTTPNGTQVGRLSIATTETWKDKTDGTTREVTEWHRVVLWGRLAEIAGQYLHKGDKVYLEGKLKTRKWTGSDGSEHYTTEIHAQELVMLGTRPGGSSQASYPPPSPRSHGTMPPSETGPVDFDDDIPF